jgi:GDP-mannose transporter
VLEHANVETFVVVRSSSPLLVAVCEWRFMGRELPNARSTATLLLILLGALGYVRNDATLSAGAAAWSGVWMCVFVFDQLYIKFVCDSVLMSSWGRVLYSNALAIVPAILLGFVFREYGVLSTYVWTRHALGALALSCLCGVGMSYSAFQLRALVSATTFTVVGILCKVLTVLINVLIWDKHANAAGLAALMVCLAAGSLYTPAPMRGATRSPAAAAGAAAAATQGKAAAASAG